MKRRLALAGAGGVVALGAAAFTARAMGGMDAYERDAASLRAPLPVPSGMADLVRHATLAPNGHNTQPWRFRLRADGVDMLPDLTRRTAVVDPDDHHLFVSLGCAAENLALAAGASGRPGQVRFDPAEGGSIAFRFGDAPVSAHELAAAITRRQSTRAEFDGSTVVGADLATLAAAAAEPGVDLVLLTDRPRIDQLRDLVVAGNTAQLGDPAFMDELTHWLRFNPRAAMAHGDGLFSGASGRPALPSWLGPTLFRTLTSAASDNDSYARQIRSSAGVAVFVGARADPEHWVRVGRACQRFALQATALGLRCAFINQPVEVAALRPALAGILGLPGRRPDIVLRFGRGPVLPYSLRRPVADVVLA
ncbi:Acg family FMN-binding oxidoreductase [Plastoroseomonas arctica]|uniref:Tat pathway signal protein n=1 Tax=Plastoroseomonas arctica TaxID=1509237 RepID=A0AAF1JZB3_9PROT|nr:nitroreductase family protein [Plastoroseomonas arctica]MBR0654138.1 Tat pathway signal protein [Plastoroseomonas arctica]